MHYLVWPSVYKISMIEPRFHYWDIGLWLMSKTQKRGSIAKVTYFEIIIMTYTIYIIELNLKLNSAVSKECLAYTAYKRQERYTDSHIVEHVTWPEETRLNHTVYEGPLISTQENFPRTENFPKISLLKVENFQLQHFFPTENLCRPITFYKILFLRKIFLSGNGR
jgi:hypothetical protein